MVLQQSSIRFTRRNSHSQLVRGANHFTAYCPLLEIQILPAIQFRIKLCGTRKAMLSDC